MSSTITIASSTTIPVASVRPNSVRLLREKPKSLTKAKVPHQRHRNGDRWNHRGAPVLQKHKDHQHHQHHRLQQRDKSLLETTPPQTATSRRESRKSALGGKRSASRAISAFTALAMARELLPGGLQNLVPHRRMAAVTGKGAVALGSQLGPAHILELDQIACRPRF